MISRCPSNFRSLFPSLFAFPRSMLIYPELCLHSSPFTWLLWYWPDWMLRKHDFLITFTNVYLPHKFQIIHNMNLHTDTKVAFGQTAQMDTMPTEQQCKSVAHFPILTIMLIDFVYLHNYPKWIALTEFDKFRFGFNQRHLSYRCIVWMQPRRHYSGREQSFTNWKDT